MGKSRLHVPNQYAYLAKMLFQAKIDSHNAKTEDVTPKWKGTPPKLGPTRKQIRGIAYGHPGYANLVDLEGDEDAT